MSSVQHVSHITPDPFSVRALADSHTVCFAAERFCTKTDGQRERVYGSFIWEDENNKI